MISYIFYIVLTSFALAQGNNPTEKINITVYYEVLCYHSVKLVQTQLYSTWTELRDYINVEFVPFGKAAIEKLPNGTWKADCQHGQYECYGNIIQACALDEFKNDSNKAVEFVHCSVSYNSKYPFNTTSTCFERIKNDTESIERFNQCKTTDKGYELLAKYGDMTPSISYVPTMYFNGVYDVNFDDKARKNLTQAVCELIKSAKPSACVKLE
ncbi:GILT-like protein 1 [Planococcus citri]|uniref:GILT-like protein 1 n=1 Tax=Planococcus citri TaxID=170843 RepID=UPI0031F728AD